MGILNIIRWMARRKKRSIVRSVGDIPLGQIAAVQRSFGDAGATWFSGKKVLDQVGFE